MPELPEVETTCRGIGPHLLGRRVARLVVRQPRLRWPVPVGLADMLQSRPILSVSRRAKYLLLGFEHGTILIHLGMSGSLRVLFCDLPPGPHDHVDLELDHGVRLRYTDPRRFGCWLWTDTRPEHHPLLAPLGPEPLAAEFCGDYLYTRARGRRTPVKAFLMDGRVVVGVGNIYANESLFQAGIDPRRAAGRVSLARYRRLATSVQEVLAAAVEQGGTTLRNFVGSDGTPGYFAQDLNVYGRAGMPCRRCGQALLGLPLGQRATVYCSTCQR